MPLDTMLSLCCLEARAARNVSHSNHLLSIDIKIQRRIARLGRTPPSLSRRLHKPAGSSPLSKYVYSLSSNTSSSTNLVIDSIEEKAEDSGNTQIEKTGDEETQNRIEDDLGMDEGKTQVGKIVLNDLYQRLVAFVKAGRAERYPAATASPSATPSASIITGCQ